MSTPFAPHPFCPPRPVIQLANGSRPHTVRPFRPRFPDYHLMKPLHLRLARLSQLFPECSFRLPRIPPLSSSAACARFRLRRTKPRCTPRAHPDMSGFASPVSLLSPCRSPDPRHKRPFTLPHPMNTLHCLPKQPHLVKLSALGTAHTLELERVIYPEVESSLVATDEEAGTRSKNLGLMLNGPGDHQTFSGPLIHNRCSDCLKIWDEC
jgi:hypothetical protein